MVETLNQWLLSAVGTTYCVNQPTSSQTVISPLIRSVRYRTICAHEKKAKTITIKSSCRSLRALQCNLYVLYWFIHTGDINCGTYRPIAAPRTMPVYFSIQGLVPRNLRMTRKPAWKGFNSRGLCTTQLKIQAIRNKISWSRFCITWENSMSATGIFGTQ